MVKLTVYSSAGDFDLSTYMNVDKSIAEGNGHYYTNTDKFGSTLFSYDTTIYHHGVPGRTVGSALYFGRNTFVGFAPDGNISGMIGDEKLSTWLAHQSLDDYTPDSLMARILVGDDQLRGNIGNDLLDGHAGADTLMGQGGDDVLMGGVGDDILVGGFGADTLTGGFGADHFVYRERHDIFGGQETITDFNHADGDKIDLTRFDASVATEGQQTIAFIGEAAFSATGAAEVRVQVASDTLNILQFDTDGNGHIDGILNVYTTAVLDATDVLIVAPPVIASIAAAFGHDTAAIASAHLFHPAQVELAHGVLA